MPKSSIKNKPPPLKAIELYEQQLLNVRKLGDRPGEANTLNNLGIAYYSRGILAKATATGIAINCS